MRQCPPSTVPLPFAAPGPPGESKSRRPPAPASPRRRGRAAGPVALRRAGEVGEDWRGVGGGGLTPAEGTDGVGKEGGADSVRRVDGERRRCHNSAARRLRPAARAFSGRRARSHDA